MEKKSKSMDRRKQAETTTKVVLTFDAKTPQQCLRSLGSPEQAGVFFVGRLIHGLLSTALASADHGQFARQPRA